MRHIGEFILLTDGRATCYANDYLTVRERLKADYKKDPSPDYCIVQVMATVPEPTLSINSIYEGDQK
jgi:hypothetical protein